MTNWHHCSHSFVKKINLKPALSLVTRYSVQIVLMFMSREEFTTGTRFTVGKGPWKRNYLTLASIDYFMQGEYKCEVVYNPYKSFGGGMAHSAPKHGILQDW